MGQDIHKLVVNGVPSQNVCGIEMEPMFVNLSYDLFLDRDKLRSTFIVDDVLNPVANFQALMGKMDIVIVPPPFQLG